LSLIVIFGLQQNTAADSGYRIYDLHRGKEMSLSEAVSELGKNRIVLVGEHHTDKQHHFAQLAVVRALKRAGFPVAIGLEMFRKDSQDDLDRWVAGKTGEKEFQRIYYDNWNYPWSAYRMIFEYARKENVPMIGLNVPRDITRQVAQKGFSSLSAEQKGQISNVACRVDKDYMDYIKSAYGSHGHGHGKFDFTYFCEAQLVWDSAMAVNTLAYLEEYPNAVVVLLAGAGHVRKGAVPRQIRERSGVSHAVILPEVEGSLEPDSNGLKDADYIILGL
jgi:uncharacterized iron-regulated protein